jgi:hypothetical protein
VSKRNKKRKGEKESGSSLLFLVGTVNNLLTFIAGDNYRSLNFSFLSKLFSLFLLLAKFFKAFSLFSSEFPIFAARYAERLVR